MPAPILHFEYSLFSKLSKPAAGVLARGSSFIADQIAELSFGKGCRITTGIGGHIAAFNNPSKQLANGSSSLRCGASPLFIGRVTWPGQSPFNSAQSIRRENSMDNNRREEELIAKLKILNMRIDWIASAEGRAALVKGFGANGEYFKEKMELVEKTEKLLDELAGKK
jgi:hypothetical protein